jgi:multiple sugar transport system permease protein
MTVRSKQRLWGAIWYIFTLACAVAVFFPYYWMFVSSVETSSMFQ